MFSVENRLVLEEIATLLGELDSAKEIGERNFLRIVRKMRLSYEEQSRRLGEAIIHAEDLREQGNRNAANEILKQFMNQSPSPFYRDVARSHLDEA